MHNNKKLTIFYGGRVLLAYNIQVPVQDISDRVLRSKCTHARHIRGKALLQYRPLALRDERIRTYR